VLQYPSRKGEICSIYGGRDVLALSGQNVFGLGWAGRAWFRVGEVGLV